MRNVARLIVAVLIVGLSACGGNTNTKPEVRKSEQNTAVKSDATQKAAPTAPTAPASTSAVAIDKKPSQGGGYYLDDGPDENPLNVDSVPNAKPKVEPLLARANRPYSALGQRYTPMKSYQPYKKQGIASWYGKRFHGRKTSSGEVYDMYGMSAAHTVLPIPSYARVTNLANGASVIVRINDRGPFKHSRLIDLSYAAAHKLNLVKAGSGLVEVETIDPNEAEYSASAHVESSLINNTVTNQVVPDEQTNANPSNLTAAQYYVQAGAFKSEANANLLQKKIQTLQLAENVGVASVYNNDFYRVKLGPYQSKNEADTSASNIRKQLNLSAIIVNQ